MALTFEERRRLRDYERELDRIVARTKRHQVRDLRRIREQFRVFKRRALLAAPDRFALTQTAIRNVLEQIARDIDQLTADLLGTLRGGATLAQATADEIAGLYAATFSELGGVLPFVSASAADLDAVMSFSARLIGLRSGGLRADVLAAIDRELQLAALGAGEGAQGTAETINRLLGEKRWSVRGERIYRTEVNRMQSIAQQRSIEQLDRELPTFKRWRWSGIQREEHARISGRIVPATGRFRVPLPRGGFALMRYPRDGAAPAAATVNCGCWVYPVPAEAAGAGSQVAARAA